MPLSKTAYIAIAIQCKDEMGDTTTGVWSAVNLLAKVNDATYDILDDLLFYRAVPLFDYVLDSLEITTTTSNEVIDYDAAIATASKTLYKLWKFTWDDRPVRYLDPDRWWEATEEHINPSEDTPFYTFSTDGTMLIRPETTGNTLSDFYCWWIKQPTAMTDSASSYSSLSEPCVGLYKYVVARNYFRGRGNYQLDVHYENLYTKKLKRIINPYIHGKLHRIQSTTKT